MIQYQNATHVYQQTRWRIDDDQSSSEGDVTLDGSEEPVRVGVLIRKTKIYIECLGDIGASLSCPAPDDLGDEETNSLGLEQRSAADYHTDRLRAKFPSAEIDLLECLGRSSWDRYQRMQHERELNTQRQDITIPGSKSRAVYSEFQDSGLGTSIPAGASSYAATVVSLMSSVAGGKRVEIPPLSAEAKLGEPFECIACGKLIRLTNDRHWRSVVLTFDP